MATYNVAQQALGGMVTLLLAKFMLNDVPHASGLLAQTDYSRPATPGQLRYISALCQQLGMQTPYEEKKMTFGEAGRMIRELQEEKRYRR